MFVTNKNMHNRMKVHHITKSIVCGPVESGKKLNKLVQSNFIKYFVPKFVIIIFIIIVC